MLHYSEAPLYMYLLTLKFLPLLRPLFFAIQELIDQEYSDLTLQNVGKEW